MDYLLVLKAALVPLFAWLLWEVIAKRGAKLLTELWRRRTTKKPDVRG
jgi:hypothetical protein